MNFLLSAFIFCLMWRLSKGDDVYYQAELRKYLKLDEYINSADPHETVVRPVEAANHTLPMNFFMGVFHITELDETKEILTVMVWIFMRWPDSRFTWNYTNFGDIYYIDLPDNIIWKPDIVLFNGADYGGENAKPYKEAFWAHHQGIIMWLYQMTLKTVCPMDFKSFPFDQHECILRFSSWSYSALQLSLSLGWSNNDYVSDVAGRLLDDNNQWIVTKSWGQRIIYNYTDVYIFHTLEYHIVLQRRSFYFGLTLVTPCVVAMMLILVSFWLPLESRERITLGAINLIILTVLSIHLYWVIPRSGSSVPTIVVCCGHAMLFAGFSMLLTVLSLRYLRQTPSFPVPSVAKRLLQGIPAKVLGLGDGFATSPDCRLLSSEGSLISPEDGTETIPDTTDTDDLTSEWIIFITAINRLAFISFLLIFIIILLSSFA